MEEEIMVIKIIVTIIGAMILVAGLYYLVKEKNDSESRKIYSIVSVIGGLIFIAGLVISVISAA